MSEVARIVSLLEQAWDGRPYYGPSLSAVLREVTAREAAWRPASGHAIWEIVGHLEAEVRYAAALLQGTAGPWVEGTTTWPAVGDTSNAAWASALENLRDAHVELFDLIRRCEEFRLDEPAAPLNEPIRAVLHGVVQHDIYHAGQIRLLARLGS